MQVKFKFLSGDVNWVAIWRKMDFNSKFNNGDFNYWAVLELINIMKQPAMKSKKIPRKSSSSQSTRGRKRKFR